MQVRKTVDDNSWTTEYIACGKESRKESINRRYTIAMKFARKWKATNMQYSHPGATSLI